MCLAVPGRVVSVEGSDPAFRTGRVSFGGIVKDVILAYTPDVTVDSYVLVHAGFAISVIDEEEADRIYSYLKAMNELGELEDAGAEPGGEA
jgi:hydrogenase expression/formation protein HypC